ncbi:MAG TPA: lytic transglycosylase domain-containing protein [Candidatus Acidoferrales bacterium]|nr:lytic transglycosylase domain-containing protein [Candidatus Acidoferrales bacterium]
MAALLWTVMAGVYALCIWMWMGSFGRQFARRGRVVRRVQSTEILPFRPHARRRSAHALRTLAVLGLASLTSTISGCAAGRQPYDGLRSWISARDATASYDRQLEPAVCPYQPWGPGSGAAPTQRDEFTFTHPRVERFVTRFQTAGRSSLRSALSRSGRYVPRMSTILRKRGLPQELAYLPLIESGFRQYAVSPAGAVGPWQLIAATGRRYGLRIDRYVDERRDPVKSTEAAAKYLKDLYAMFGNWHLSLAAYNSGEQNIVRILEAGDVEDFWEMRRRGYLCAETADFVPQFLAALHIAQTPETYGFDAATQRPLRYDLVRVQRPLSLATVARLSGTSTRTIEELNPALRRGVVPPRGYAVRVPKGTKAAFEFAYAGLSGTGHGHHRVRPATTKAVVEARLPALFANFGG